jgi:hypothetical protein
MQRPHNCPHTGSDAPLRRVRDVRKEGEAMFKWVAGIVVVVIIALIAGGIIVASRSDDEPREAVARPQIISMEESGRAMQAAGATMQRHGQAMMDYADRVRRSMGAR